MCSHCFNSEVSMYFLGDFLEQLFNSVLNLHKWHFLKDLYLVTLVWGVTRLPVCLQWLWWASSAAVCPHHNKKGQKSEKCHNNSSNWHVHNFINQFKAICGRSSRRFSVPHCSGFFFIDFDNDWNLKIICETETR